MAGETKISERVTVGPQPDEARLQQLARDGFKTVVNLRKPAEEDQPLPPELEGLKVRELGMNYLHIPVASNDMHVDQLDRFSEQLHTLPGPAYVHCRGGKRAAIFALLDTAEKEGWTSEETFRRGTDCGYSCESPETREFVRGYLRTRRRAT